MNQILNEITVNNITYVPKGTNTNSVEVNGLKAVIVGAGIGGIHFGFLKERKGCEVTLLNARRIQYWDGAASITEMAARGVSKPQNCRFSTSVYEIVLPNVVEVLTISPQALKNLQEVPVLTK